MHHTRTKEWMKAVDETYNNFRTRMESYRRQLEKTLGIQNRAPRDDMTSNGLKEKSLHREYNEEKRKSARKREYVHRLKLPF